MAFTQPIGLNEPEPPPQGDGNGRVTPVMEQYIEIKAANPDCLLFYRMGDFYELFFEDAETASRALGIVLTKRGKHHGQDIPMCGVPVIRADEYLHRLIALGHRVAVCEQLEDPAEARKRGNKSVVRRDVVRLVTPGTLTEDTLLDAKRNNYLLAVARARTVVGRRGRPFRAGLDRHLDRGIPHHRMRPAVAAGRDRAAGAERDHRLRRAVRRRRSCAYWRELPAVTPLTRDVFDSASAERRLTSFFSVATSEAFGTLTRLELTAAAACVTYVERTQIGKRPPLSPPLRESGLRHHGNRPGHARQSRIDAHALRRAARLALGGDRPHRHLGRLAPAGATIVGAADRSEGNSSAARRSGEFRRGRGGARRYALAAGAAPDLARALARLAVGRGGPRDLAAIRDGVLAAADLARALAALKDIPAEIADALASCRRPDGMLAAELAAALAPELPALKRDGGFVREGYDASLDETRASARRIPPRCRRAASEICRTDRHSRA